MSESLEQRGGQAESSSREAQQLHGGVGVQAEPRSQPQQGGRGQQLLQQGLPAVAQLPAGRQQTLIPIETCTKQPWNFLQKNGRNFVYSRSLTL